MFKITYNPYPAGMTFDILMNIPLLLKNKEQIYSSVLLYNIETGCYFAGKDGLDGRYELHLGELLSLWEGEYTPWEKYGNPWHFYDASRQEVFTYKIREQADGQLLCFGWQLKSKKSCVFIVNDTIQDETWSKTQIMLSSAPIPDEIQDLTINTYRLDSVYSTNDLVKSLKTNRPIKDVFEERIIKDPYALGYCKDGSYLYPTNKKSCGFYIKTFN